MYSNSKATNHWEMNHGRSRSVPWEVQHVHDKGHGAFQMLYKFGIVISCSWRHVDAQKVTASKYHKQFAESALHEAETMMPVVVMQIQASHEHTTFQRTLLACSLISSRMMNLLHGVQQPMFCLHASANKCTACKATLLQHASFCMHVESNITRLQIGGWQTIRTTEGGCRATC